MRLTAPYTAPFIAGLAIALLTGVGGWQAGSLAQSKKGKGKGKAAKKEAKKVAIPLFKQAGKCGECHMESGWWTLKKIDKKQFDHAVTGFALSGGHEKPNCADCHRRGLSKLSPSCSSCHKDPHAGANSMACEQCHNDRSWKVPRNFFAHERTRFPLTGVHASLACEECHRNARGEALAMTPTECSVCHVRDRIRAQPNHVAAGFTQCGWCHTTSSFRRGQFRHRAYVLDGAHALQDCTDCHVGTTFQGLASGGTDCLVCHQVEFNSTAALPGIPDHTLGAPFGSDCGRCHQNVSPPLSFQGAVIN